MKIQDIYKNEMGEDVFFRSIFGQKAYSDKYIKWLEGGYKQLKERERHCKDMNEAEMKVLFRGVQEIQELLGLDLRNSINETVEKLKAVLGETSGI